MIKDIILISRRLLREKKIIYKARSVFKLHDANLNWDTEKFEVFVIFLNKQKEELKKIKLFEKDPWDVDPFGKMGWDQKTSEFYLYSKDEKPRWAAKLS